MRNFLFCLLFIPVISFSQYGVLDETFGDGGIVINNDLPSYINSPLVMSMVVTQNNDIYVIGNYLSEFEESWIGGLFLVKYFSNGAIDESFGDSGFKGLHFDNISLKSSQLLLMSDNTLLMTVMYDSIEDEGNNADIFLIKLDLDGNIISSFGNEGKLNIDCAYCTDGQTIEVGNDIYVSASIIGPNGAHALIKKFSNLGDPILSFGENGVVSITDPIYNKQILNIQSDENNQLFVHVLEDDIISNLIKLDEFGNEIGNVSLNTENTLERIGFITYRENKIYTPGSYNTEQFILKRYDPETLAIDTDFGENGTVYTDFGANLETAGRVLILHDRIYEMGWVGVDFLSTKIGIAAYRDNGEMDNTFGENGRVETVFPDQTLNYTVDADFLGTNRLLVLNYRPIGIVCYKIYDGLSVEDLNTDPAIRIAPNPASNSFQISGLKGTDNQIQISDLSGKLIREFNSVQDKQKIELGSILKGVYIIKITSGEKSESKKLLVK